MARTYEEMMARMDELEKAQAAATAAPVPAPPAARVPAAPKSAIAPGMEALPKPSAAPSAPTVTRRAVSVTPKVEEIKAPKPPEVEAPKPVGLTPDLAKPIDYKKVYDNIYTSGSVDPAVSLAARSLDMTDAELKRLAQAQGVDLDALVSAKQKGRTYDEIAKAGRERGVIGFMPVEEREKAFNKLAQDVEKAQRGDAGDTVELVRSGADKGFGPARALGGYTIAGTQEELPEVAKPGEHGYAIAQILVEALQKDPSAVRAYDLYGRSLATGNTQRYIDDRVEDLRKRANIKASDADAMEKMAALRKRAINEVIAYKTVGQWTPVVTLGDVEVREGRASPGALAALKPNIEIIGFNNKRQAIFRQESPMGVLFRVIDIPQAAIAGVLSGQTVGQGIQSGANLLEYSLDATKDSAMYVKAPVVAAGFAASILFPDALVAAGAASKAVKAVSKIRAARKIAPEATALLETIVRTRKAGDYEAAAAAEKQLRSLLPDVASNLDSADAAVARFQKLAEPESDILDTDLAALIAGAAPEQARVVAGRPFLHPSLRKFVVGPSGLEQADYAELFDTRRQLDRVQRAKAEYIKARTTGRSITDYTKDYIRGRVHDVFENLPPERQLSLTQVNRMADLISAQAPAALLDQKQFKKAVEDALKADAEFGTDAYKMARQDAYKAIGGRTETKLDEIRGKTIEELEAADMGLFDRAIKAIEQNNTARGVAAQLLRDEIAGAARLRVEPLELFDEVAPKLSSGEPIRLTPGGLLLLHHLRQAYPKQDFKEAYATITIIDKMIEGAAQAREVSPLALYQEIFPLIKRGTPEDLKRLAGDLKAGKVPTGGAPTGGAPAAPAAPTKAARARAEAKLREMMRRLGDEELDEIEGMLRADGVQEGEAYALDAIKREKQRRAREAKKAAAATPAAAPVADAERVAQLQDELAQAVESGDEFRQGELEMEIENLRRMAPPAAEAPAPVVVEEVVEAPAKVDAAFEASLAQKYGAPPAPVVPAAGPQEAASRYSNLLERAARRSSDADELSKILAAASGLPHESRIAWEVASNPNTNEATFRAAKENPTLRAMATDAAIADLEARRAPAPTIAAPPTPAPIAAAAEVQPEVTTSWEGARVIDPFRKNAPGVVVKWEPLGTSMTDALVRYDDGTEMWVTSSTLRPEGGTVLPTRAQAIRAADEKALADLKAARERLIAEFGEKWQGAEFGKAQVGTSLNQAIAEVEARLARAGTTEPPTPTPAIEAPVKRKRATRVKAEAVAPEAAPAVKPPDVFPSIEAEAPMPSGIPSARAVQTETPAFKAWFGGSKVVDAEGKPLVVYHGTSAAGFDVFRPNYRKGEQLGFGIHFAQDRDFAAKYAEDPNVARRGKSPAVYEVYLSIQRPLVADAIVIEGTPEFTLAKKLAGNNLLTQRNEDGVLMAYMQGAIDKTSAQRAEKLIREAGYDGIVYEAQLAVPTAFGWARTGSSRSFIVFEPTQIKSATGNVGTFSQTDPSILKQVSPTGEVKGAVEWLEDGSSVVYLFEGADASTVLHEVAHVVRRNILSNEDMGFIASWVQGLGVNVGHQYGEFTGDAAEIEKAEELFAKAFEQYVAEGKAPAGLEGAFAQLKDAVANVYKAVKDPVIGVELQPEVRRVFDGLFATEPKQADQSLKEAIRRGILGGPEAEVDILTVLSREAKRKGLDEFSPDELATRINKAKANIKQIAKRDPTGTDVVLKFETKVLGKDKWTINDLAAAQAARDARLAPQAEARMALLRDMTGRGRGKAAIYKQDTAVESLWTALSAKETDAPMTKQAKKALRGVASLYFGGSVLEETKMAGQPPAFRRALDTSARIVEQSLADTVALVNDAVATGDDTQLLRYLTGDADVAKVSGRPILSSGHDKMGAVNRMIQRAIAAFKDDEKEALIELADAINTKDPVERGQKLVTLGFTAAGGEVPFKEADEARKAMSDALRRAVGKLLYPEKKDADIGTALAAAIRDSVNAPDKARPSHELRLVETLTYIGGVTARDGDLFKGDSKDMVRTLLGDIRKIYGEIGEESARRVAVQIGAFGGADQAKQFLVRMDLGVDEKTQAAFARFLNGEQPGAENIAGVKRMFDTFGRDIQFVPDAALDVDFYIPRAARERMAQVLSRAQFRTEESVGAADALATSYRYMKTRMTRGNFFIRQRYFMMNTVDHFNAMAYTEGFGIAAASTARVIAQDLLVVPLMREILEVGKAAGVLSPVATERLRSSLQNLGDRAAGRIGKMMSVGKYRIEVNPILEGVDGGFTVGGKVYRYRDIRDIAVEEGVFSSFDTRELQRAILREGQLVLGDAAAQKAVVRSPTRLAWMRNGLASLEESVSDIAEAWGERERLGAMVTLMEAGYDPRAAAQITVKALFDYSQSMTKLDRLWLVNLLLPFWAFQKNANQQVFNMLFSPWGGYRMMVVKRARERTSDLLGNIMYNTLVDDYGVDVESMPPELQDSYYATIKAFEEAFGPDGPPPEAKRAMRMLLSGRAIDVEDGVLMETSAEIQRLRSAGAFADLARFIPFTVAEPSKAGRSSIMRDRAGFPVPFPRSEGVRTYNALLGDNHSYMELYWPDSTIEAGMKWHTQVAATMFLLAAEGAAETGLTGLREGGIDEVTVQRVLQPIIDVERSPLIAPFLEQPPPKRIAAAATPEAWMKVHPMLGKMLDDVYGTTFLRVPAVADPLLVDEDGNLPQLTPDQITEIKRLQEQYPDIGVLKNQRYYLPGGVWATAFENSPLGELNALLLRWEEEPLESQGRQTIQGKILIWSRKYAGVDVTLTAPSQAAKREEPRKKTETAGTKTF